MKPFPASIPQLVYKTVKLVARGCSLLERRAPTIKHRIARTDAGERSEGFTKAPN